MVMSSLSIAVLVLTASSMVLAQSDVDHGRRIFISARNPVIDDESIPDKEMEDSVKDLKDNFRKEKDFVVVESKDEADLVLVVVKREVQQGRPSILAHKTPRMESHLECALYYKEAGNWKPGIKLTGRAKYWKDSAFEIKRDAKKWIHESLPR